MIVRNNNLLKQYRLAGNCEWCGKHCVRREPAHVVSRGIGGSDIAINLVALGSSNESESASCRCHSLSHAGQSPTRAELLELVAQREGFTVEAIEDVIAFFRNLDKYASCWMIDEQLREMSETARMLALRELAEAGIP